MKGVLPVLVALLVPCAALAADKDPQLGVSYEVVNLQCNTATNVLPTCSASTNSTNYPELSVTKRVHSATIRLFAEPGQACEAHLSMTHTGGPIGSFASDILAVFATEQSPGALAIAFPQPILLVAGDQFGLQLFAKDSDAGGCIGAATVGVELLTQIGDIILR